MAGGKQKMVAVTRRIQVREGRTRGNEYQNALLKLLEEGAGWQ